jgi:hypothetical protein
VNGEIWWSDDYSEGQWHAGGQHERYFAGIYFTDERHGFIDADNGVWATSDGGEHWKRVQDLPWRDANDVLGHSRFVRAGDTLLLLRSVDLRPAPSAIEIYARRVTISAE